jgi:hypothetical protein
VPIRGVLCGPHLLRLGAGVVAIHVLHQPQHEPALNLTGVLSPPVASSATPVVFKFGPLARKPATAS